MSDEKSMPSDEYQDLLGQIGALKWTLAWLIAKTCPDEATDFLISQSLVLDNRPDLYASAATLNEIGDHVQAFLKAMKN